MGSGVFTSYHSAQRHIQDHNNMGKKPAGQKSTKMRQSYEILQVVKC
jgi:hypothetical protein